MSQRVRLGIKSMGGEIQLGAKNTGGSVGLGVGAKTAGVTDYNALTNKPSINGETVIGEKISRDYGLQDKMDIATVAEIEAILYLD